MEIERKFLVKKIPENLEQYPCLFLEQAYLCTSPVVRVRKENDDYYLTYKGKGKMIREEYNLPLTQEAYEHLLAKADGEKISKRRFKIPLTPYTVELDLFDGILEGLVIAEVEFPTEEEALCFTPPAWFQADVTNDHRYHNSFLSQIHTVKEKNEIFVP
ncbi:CYTH domain-containing protein [Hominifimenecus sp. rT4P-3]|uniref:CYTH domain-containing protein n=1 Tax=Hominifimenecus sp. rT4P-3 TaxID=3242979 RepID=UPI003DA3720B